MKKFVYISADYSEYDGDRDVVQKLNEWTNDHRYLIEFTDMASVKSGSVSEKEDCRICELKEEFNRQINKASYVIFVVGNKIACRTAGSACNRGNYYTASYSWCTPYKSNRNGVQPCNRYFYNPSGDNGDCCYVNSWSYLRHEYEQAVKKNKGIIVLYNSTRKEKEWLPSYLKQYESIAIPFWMYNDRYERVGNYASIKKALGF